MAQNIPDHIMNEFSRLLLGAIRCHYDPEWCPKEMLCGYPNGVPACIKKIKEIESNGNDPGKHSDA